MIRNEENRRKRRLLRAISSGEISLGALAAELLAALFMQTGRQVAGEKLPRLITLIYLPATVSVRRGMENVIQRYVRHVTHTRGSARLSALTVLDLTCNHVHSVTITPAAGSGDSMILSHSVISV